MLEEKLPKNYKLLIPYEDEAGDISDFIAVIEAGLLSGKLSNRTNVAMDNYLDILVERKIQYDARKAVWAGKVERLKEMHRKAKELEAEQLAKISRIRPPQPTQASSDVVESLKASIGSSAELDPDESDAQEEINNQG